MLLVRMVSPVPWYVFAPINQVVDIRIILRIKHCFVITVQIRCSTAIFSNAYLQKLGQTFL